MKTFVSIDRLQIFARHGVFEEETVNGNLFEVSVKLEYDFLVAAKSDDINYALNYAELTATVIDVMDKPRKLIESVAYEMQKRIMEQWPEIISGVIEITKLHPPIPYPTPRASVVITW